MSAFLSSLMGYLVIMAGLIAVGAVGVFAGVKMRKNKDAKTKQEDF